MASATITPEVQRAVILLRQNPGWSKAHAAREAGCSREGLRDALARGETATDALTGEIDPGEIPVIVREYDADHHYVYPLGDVHIGSPNFQLDRWREWLDYVGNTPTASVLGTGDFLNVALKDSVSDVYTEQLTVGDAKRKLRDDLKPLAQLGRLDALTPGNHEARIARAIGDCPILDVSEALAVPYFPTAAVILYRVGEVEYDLYVRHGSGSGRAGAQANRMERESLITAADIYVAGHTHRVQAIRGAIFVREGEEVVRRRQLYITAGSMLSYEDYAAKSGLPPADIAVPRIRLNGERKDAHVSI